MQCFVLLIYEIFPKNMLLSLLYLEGRPADWPTYAVYYCILFLSVFLFASQLNQKKMQNLVILLMFLILDFADLKTSNPEQVPVFDENVPTAVTVHQGDTANLRCRIFNAENMTVAWVQQSNWHILTIDHMTLSPDERVSSLINFSENLWTLKIKNVTATDHDNYECQVHPSSTRRGCRRSWTRCSGQRATKMARRIVGLVVNDTPWIHYHRIF